MDKKVNTCFITWTVNFFYILNLFVYNDLYIIYKAAVGVSFPF